MDHLRAELARVEALGGEGLMARRPGSRYEVGSSATPLKIKNFQDAEARVVEHLKGAGRLCLLKKEGTSKRSIKGNRLRASWDEGYLQQALCGNVGN